VDAINIVCLLYAEVSYDFFLPCLRYDGPSHVKNIPLIFSRSSVAEAAEPEKIEPQCFEIRFVVMIVGKSSERFATIWLMMSVSSFG